MNSLIAIYGPTAVTVAIGLCLVGLGVAMYFIGEYILPHKPYWIERKPHLPRRHLESISAWSKRHAEAMGRYSNASIAIVNCPDAVRTQFSARGFTYSLPANHPVAVARLAAEYPDGPSYAELAQMVGIKPAQSADDDADDFHPVTDIH